MKMMMAIVSKTNAPHIYNARSWRLRFPLNKSFNPCFTIQIVIARCNEAIIMIAKIQIKK